MKILALFAPLVLLAAAAFQDAAEPAPPTVVFLLRHAEADGGTQGDRDPALAEAGTERARELARLLGVAGVTHLFASEYQRTQLTLAPLAEALEHEVVVLSARDADAQIAALRELPAGSVAVVAGHSNTVPQLAAKLGVTMRDTVEQQGYGTVLPHDAYDRIAEVILPAGGAPARLVELRYGE